MRSMLPIALIMGVLSGLLVGGFFNVFNVPVMEWAISLEEAAAAGGAPEEEGGIAVSLGMQRMGMVFGLAVVGILFGAVFTGLYHLVRRATPGWNMWAWAGIAALLGFWAVSLFTQIKYPLNPPGIGDEASLLARQGFQFLFMALSLLSVVGVCLAVKLINDSGAAGLQQVISYAAVAIAYAVVVTIAFLAIPGNPDAAPAWLPDALVIMFRSLTIIGHFLLWLGIALGVVGYIKYKEHGVSMKSPESTRSGVAVR